jgi:DeoR family transcriptional regulator, fructose operon transcriptional repressor
MNKYHRKEKILDYISGKNSSSIDELMQHFSVSVSTIHRDLNMLEREGRIEKVYGRAMLKEEKVLYRSRIDINVELKKKIAKKALQYIENGDCIFLDNSTTSFYLAEALCNSAFNNILVISNSAFLSDLFLKNENIDLVVTGGMLNKELNCFIGPQTIKTIDDFNGNKFFLSSSYVSIKGGISDIYQIDIIEVKLKMLQKSKESFLLIDSTKFGKTGSSKYFELSEMDHIITDSKILESEVQTFKRNGFQLIIT